MSAVINDVERARHRAFRISRRGFSPDFFLFAFLSVLFYRDWRMTLGCAIFLPLVVWPIGKLGVKSGTPWKAAEQAGRVESDLQKRGRKRVVKAIGMEDFEIGKFRAAAKRLLRETMRWVSTQVVSSPLMDLLLPVVFRCSCFMRATNPPRTATIGLFFTFVYALFKSYEPVKAHGAVTSSFSRPRAQRRRCSRTWT